MALQSRNYKNVASPGNLRLQKTLFSTNFGLSSISTIKIGLESGKNENNKANAKATHKTLEPGENTGGKLKQSR